MSASDESLDKNLPGNYSVQNIPAVSPYGTRLSRSLFDPTKLIRFRRVSISGGKVSLPSGTQADVSLPSVVGEDALYLDINPRSLSITKAKAINTNNYTRAGYVPQYWGEELDVISVQGTTAAFISDQHGLTRQEANNTSAYRNFMNLLLLYKNNGATFQKNTTRASEASQTLANIKSSYKKREAQQRIDSQITSTQRRVIDKRCLIELKYSDLLCYGNFESFTYSETAEKPFNFDYSFEFVVLFYNEAPTLEGHI